MLGVLLGIVFVGGFIALLSTNASKAKEARLGRLDAIAKLLGGEHDRSSKAWGGAFGAKTSFEFATRGSGSSSENWTLIRVEVPAAYPLELHVRRHLGGDRMRIERGAMVDVQIGDDAFDAAFLIEAAPADVVRVLLDRPIRDILNAHKEVDLETATQADGTRVICLGVRGWLEDIALAEAPIRVMASLGGRVREAYAEVDAAQGHPAVGDPYRPTADADAARAAQAFREAEVDRVTAVREKRAADAQRAAMIFMALIALIVAVSMCR